MKERGLVPWNGEQPPKSNVPRYVDPYKPEPDPREQPKVKKEVSEQKGVCTTIAPSEERDE